MSVLYQYFETTLGDLYQTLVGTGWGAQTFSPSTSHDIGKVSLYIYKLGTPSAITVSIRDTTTGAPSGVDKAVGTIAVGDIGTSAAWVDCTFVAPYALVASRQYAIVLRCTGSSGTHQIYWSYLTTGGYTGGNKDFSVNSGSTWLGTETGKDHHFREYSLGNLYPSDATTRVTGIVHRYDRRKGIYQMEISLGDVTSLLSLSYSAAARRATLGIVEQYPGEAPPPEVLARQLARFQSQLARERVDMAAAEHFPGKVGVTPLAGETPTAPSPAPRRKRPPVISTAKVTEERPIEDIRPGALRKAKEYFDKKKRTPWLDPLS